MGGKSSKGKKPSNVKVVKASPADTAAVPTSNVASLKVVVVGDVNTGKTSLLMRFATNTFSAEMNTDYVSSKLSPYSLSSGSFLYFFYC